MDRRQFNDPFAQEADTFSGGQLAWPDLDLDGDDILHLQGLSPPAANGAATSSGGSGTNRKLTHNAYERDRRKQLNDLYSSLRSVLPDADHTKKLSIPTTVSQAIKYIPELQKQVDTLERRKKELTTAHCKPGALKMNDCSITPVVSATCINDMEIMVQVSLPTSLATTALPLSKCIKLLENEGVQLISSSSHSTFENRTFYSLHLQRSKRTMNKECPAALCESLERVIRKKAGV